jgi:RHS repeat-associated protein
MVDEDNAATSADHHYCHDARNQLTGRGSTAACGTSDIETFSYDDAGNRSQAVEGGTTRNFAYTTAGLLCDVETGAAASCTGGNIGSDDAGRISDHAGWHFDYDASARLVAACDNTSCAGSGFDRVDFSYDGEGHRTAIVATPAAGSPVVTTTFRYQGDAIVAESVGGTLTREYMTDDSGTISKVIVPTGGSAGTYLVTWNGHGDAMALHRIETNGTLTLANSYTYSTWGTPTTTTHNGIADLGFRFLYVGAYDVQWDDQFGLGLTYMHARHYSPTLGRFLQPDPSRLDAEFFVYTENSPVSKVDPSGEIVWCAIPFIGWAACAAGARLVLWGAGNWLGSMLIRSGPALTNPVAGKVPLAFNLSRDNWARVTQITATITKANLRTGTAATQAARNWCCNDQSIYEAGHLIAKVLGGPGGVKAGNIVPMLRTLNNGAYKKLELSILKYVEAGNKVEVILRPTYSGTSITPTGVWYIYRVAGGRWYSKLFDN